MNNRSNSAAVPDDDALDFAAVLQDRSRDPGLRKTERTRLRLLAGLAGELAAEGRRDGRKVAAVSASAGVAHGTFYRYFGDIQAGLDALIDAFSVFVRERLDGAQYGDLGSRERIGGIAGVQIRLFRDNAALIGCLLDADRAGARESVQARSWEWLMRMAATIAKGRAALGAARQSPSELLPVAYAIQGMVEAFLARIYLRRDPELADLADDEAALAEFLAEMWCRVAYGDALDHTQ